MSLRKKTVSGLFWTFSQQFSVQLIHFLVSVVLARLLAPAEFGLIAMLSVFIALGISLMDSGLTSSLIRTPNPDQKDYSTVFFINVVGSVVAYVILFFAAPAISLFYKQDILTDIIRVYTLTFIIQAFVGVQKTRLTKEMNFKSQMTIQIPSVIGGGVLGIILAYNGYGVWSLVWSNLFQTSASAIQHWLFTKWRPSLVFDKKRFRMHFSFGYRMTLSGLLHTLYSNLYTIIIGKYYSATQLGFYSRALALRQLPVSNISLALNKVTYPMFSSISHDEKKLKMVYKKLIGQLFFWLAPTLVYLSIIAEPLIRLLLTEKWLPSVPYFQILCFAGIMYPLNNYNLNILKVKGRSDLYFKLEIVKKIILTIGVFCAIPFGIYGLLYFQLISSVIVYFINTSYSGNLINYPIREQVKDILPTALLTIFIGMLSWLLDYYLDTMFGVNDWGRIFIAGICFSLSYLGLSSLIKFPALADFRQLILQR